MFDQMPQVKPTACAHASRVARIVRTGQQLNLACEKRVAAVEQAQK
jgi:hypothetical protein